MMGRPEKPTPFRTHTYKWGGGVFKTIRGLHGAVLRAYPDCAITFEKSAMVLIFRNGARMYFDRILHNGMSVISTQPSSVKGQVAQ